MRIGGVWIGDDQPNHSQCFDQYPAFEIRKNHGHPPDDQVTHFSHPLEI